MCDLTFLDNFKVSPSQTFSRIYEVVELNVKKSIKS